MINKPCKKPLVDRRAQLLNQCRPERQRRRIFLDRVQWIIGDVNQKRLNPGRTLQITGQQHDPGQPGRHDLQLITMHARAAHPIKQAQQQDL
ncbi:hypothetical protein D3C75_691570 [compost metagenome]